MVLGLVMTCIMIYSRALEHWEQTCIFFISCEKFIVLCFANQIGDFANDASVNNFSILVPDSLINFSDRSVEIINVVKCTKIVYVGKHAPYFPLRI